MIKTLGILGGIGPESTVEYYRTIISLYRERTKDGSYPKIILNSIDLKEELVLVERDVHESLTTFMIGELEKLAKAGADFAIIASNTPHIVFDEVAARSSLPLISIVETACAAATARQLKRLALFGARYTMQGRFYQKVFEKRRIELVVPELADQNYIHDKYMNELVAGIFLPETRRGLLAVVDKMRATKEIDGVLLAGTELPLILRDPIYNGLPILDTMRIHATAAVAEILRET